MQNNPFQLTIATGRGFCNRTEEKELICNNMRSGIHTVVYAPRRYGKSSLSMEVETMLPEMTCIRADLLSVTSSEDVAEKLYQAIVSALGRKATDKLSLASRIMSFFKRLRLTIEINATTSLPEFSVSLGEDSSKNHLEHIIGSLDSYCADQGIKICLVLDAFQEICELKDSKTVEALLRGGMQVAKNISFLMMGSRRTILRDMFEDRKRPFYKSAYVLPLKRISTEEFAPFLVSRFALYGLCMPEQVAVDMVEYVDAYPYYVQKLAMICFNMQDMSNEGVEAAKETLLAMESADFEAQYISLTNHQKRLLRAIARHNPTSIFSQEFLKIARLGSQGGVQTSISKLKKMDMVENKDNAWKVVDPLLAKWLLKP